MEPWRAAGTLLAPGASLSLWQGGASSIRRLWPTCEVTATRSRFRGLCLLRPNRGSKQEPQGVGTPLGLLQGRSSPQAAPRAPERMLCSKWLHLATLQVEPHSLSTQDHFLCNKRETDGIEKTGEPLGHPRPAGILRGGRGQCATVYVSLRLHRVGSSSVQGSGLPALFLDTSPEPMAVGRKGANRIRRALRPTAGLPLSCSCRVGQCRVASSAHTQSTQSP